jgi:saccharopine dehydrogenase-like NADP-dependent oxidoreductase
MKQILVVGAGRSASSLIEYLVSRAAKNNWFVVVADYDLKLSESKVSNSENSSAISFDVNNKVQREKMVSSSELVISMLPAHMHILLASDCIKFGKNMVTASYVSDQIKSLHNQAIEKDIIILNEIGLDPGIDHMSAKKMIDEVHEKGGEINSFKSFCGGLVAPEFDNNPWNYKFTWNPRNVVLAGQSTAMYIHNREYKYIPYHSLFTRIEEVEILSEGIFEAYANRDSLSYREIYDLPNIATMLRGTLRKKGFCSAWNIFVQLGMTDDSFQISNYDNMTWRSFLNSFLDYDDQRSVEQKLINSLSVTDQELKKMEWLGILSEEKINLSKGTPAQFLQELLESKLNLDKGDKDMIVMQHQLECTISNQSKKLTSSLVLKGVDDLNTAMSMTVGLPVAIATELILNNKISNKGVVIPIHKEIYMPVLEKLKEFGIEFIEE